METELRGRNMEEIEIGEHEDMVTFVIEEMFNEINTKYNRSTIEDLTLKNLIR